MSERKADRHLIPIREGLSATEAIRLWKLAGLPTNGKYRKQYNRLYSRARRENPEFRRLEAESSARWRRAHPSEFKLAVSSWKEKHKAQVSQINRRYHLEVRQNLCQVCHRSGVSGRGGVMPARATFLDRYGNLIVRQARLCYKCRRDAA